MKSHYLTSFFCYCLLLLISWLAGSQVVQAQVRPVQATLQLTPPYSVYLSDYGIPGSAQMKLHLLLRDIAEPDYPVRLHLVVEGNGIRIETNPAFQPQPIYLQGGIPNLLSGEELAPYLESQHLLFSGISRQNYEQKGSLPDGMYTFTVRVLDYRRVDVVLSNEAVFSAWFMLNDPPRINTPMCGAELKLTDPQSILFQWMAGNTGAAAFDTEYEFTLVEVRPAGRNPEDAIRSITPLYQQTTDFTSLVYGLSEPALIPGQQYAFRVRARDRQGRDLFKNQGYSTTCSFTYGDIDPLEPPEGINVYAETIRRARISWQMSITPDSYRVSYRKQPKEDGDEQAYSWFHTETSQDELMIYDLEPATTYEIKVASLFQGFASRYTNTQPFTTPAIKAVACGETPAVRSYEEVVPLPTAMAGQYWQVGQFEMQLLEVRGGDGTFSGIGSITVPYLNMQMPVSFDDVQVNKNRVLYTGEVVAIREDIEAFRKRWQEENPAEEIIDEPATAQQQPIASTQEAIAVAGESLTIEGTIATVTVNEAGQIVIIQEDGSTQTYQQAKDEESGEKKVTTIADSKGNSYTVDQQGKVSGGNGGAPPNASLPAKEPVRVTFTLHQQQQYGLDMPRQDYAAVQYPVQKILNKDYTIGYKAIANGRQEYLTAQWQSADSLGLSYHVGNALVSMTGKADDGKQTLTLTGTGDQLEDQLVVYQNTADEQGKTQEVITGAINLISYDQLLEQLVVVPVNDVDYPYSSSSLQAALNDIFGQAVVQWQVTVDKPLLVSDWDENKDGKVDDGSSGMLSNYTAEMRKILKEYKKERGFIEDKFYLFIANASESGNKRGYMPRKKQAGFIFLDVNNSEAALTTTIAHELAHGAYRLEHIFAEKNTTQGQTDNLMDYNNGHFLHKYQWDYIHDPVSMIALFDSGEDGAMEINFCEVSLKEKLNAIHEANLKKDKTISFYLNNPEQCELWNISLGNYKYDVIAFNIDTKGDISFSGMEYRKREVSYLGSIEGEFVVYEFGDFKYEDYPIVALSVTLTKIQSPNLELYLFGKVKEEEGVITRDVFLNNAITEMEVHLGKTYKQESGTLRTDVASSALEKMDCSELVSRFIHKVTSIETVPFYTTNTLLNLYESSNELLEYVVGSDQEDFKDINPGDIFLWRTNSGGHTGIVTSFNEATDQVTILEAIGSSGSAEESLSQAISGYCQGCVRKSVYSRTGNALQNHQGWKGYFRPKISIE